MRGAILATLAVGVAALLLSACVTTSGGASTPTQRSDSGHGALARLTAVRLQVPAANRAGAFTAARRLEVPRGWRAEVWALVPDARFEALTPAGNLLVSEPAAGRIVELLVNRSDRGRVPTRRVLVSGLNEPQGMAFDRIGGHEVLYVAETDRIDRYHWRGSRLGARRVLIGGLPSGSDHTLKEIVVDRAHDLYFDIGSTANASPPPHSNPPWASVMKYAPSGRRIRVWARGVRNGDGLSFAPDGSLWTAVNQRDNIAYPFHRSYGRRAHAFKSVISAYVNNHPPDEIARLTPGRDLGWPYCDPDPDLRRGSPTTRLRYGNLPFDNDAQTNPSGHALDCATLPRLNRGIAAHSAPLGFHFLNDSSLPARWRGGAVVAAHGSWNRQPPRPARVLWLPWQPRAHTLGPAITLISGFQARDGSRWGRAVDAIPGADGALYVSDDTAGAIYRLVPGRR